MGVGTWNSTSQTSLSKSWYILYQFSFMYLWMFSKWSYFNTQFNMGEFASLSALSLACILWNFSDLKINFSVNSRTATSKKLHQFSLSCLFIEKIALWQDKTYPLKHKRKWNLIMHKAGRTCNICQAKWKLLCLWEHSEVNGSSEC